MGIDIREEQFRESRSPVTLPCLHFTLTKLITVINCCDNIVI